MATKQRNKSKISKQRELQKFDQLIERFHNLADLSRSSARKLEAARQKAAKTNPTLKSLVRRIEVLNASPGDLIILTAKPAAIDKLQAILEKYSPAFTARGLEVMITDGSCDITLAKKQ